MKYTVRCGKKYPIRIDRKIDLSETVNIQVGKRQYLVKIKDTYSDGKIKTLIVNNKVFPVQVQRRKDAFPTLVTLNGIPYDVCIDKVESTRYRPPAVKRTISGKIKSALPGQIQAVLVEEGEKVRKGQPVLILESMKMENEIIAPKNGIVKRIAVTSGQSVMKGHILIEIA